MTASRLLRPRHCCSKIRDVEIVYLLIPLAAILAAVIIWVFLWSVRSGQFDDLEGPAHRILMDDEDQTQSDRHDSKSA